jgi:hypothetical protein
MNLNNNPMIEQLRELLGQANDREGNHVLWVKKNGDVELSLVRHPRVPVKEIRNHPAVLLLESENPNMQMRCETFLAGNEYVGPKAVANEEYVKELFDLLLTEWQHHKGKRDVGYVSVSDDYCRAGS